VTRSVPHPDDTHGKALALNLDGSIYGTFAEIGAGQEVARWFLRVGAASGTVAKTICAYDKKVSDDIYGTGTRYVSKERLVAMLDREFGVLVEQLGGQFGPDRRFFTFADTVAARNFKGDNAQHGWMGIRFQGEPGAAPSQVLLHVNLRDDSARLQQQAIGMLGVNLVYATFQQRENREVFLAGLFEDLTIERLEIDVIELDGPAFAGENATAWGLALLMRQMAHAVVFDGGRAVEPSGVLRKRPLLILRGTFSHPELLDTALLESARRLLTMEGPFERDPAALFELSVHHVQSSRDVPEEQMLARVAELSAPGPLIVTDYPETYLLARYLRRHTTEPVRFVVSVAAAAKILHEDYYRQLPGTLLEGLGRLLATNVKLYVAPLPLSVFEAALQDLPGKRAIDSSSDGMVTLDELRPEGPMAHLLAYLMSSGRLVGMEHAAPSVAREG
jgi:hypothetical protein